VQLLGEDRLNERKSFVSLDCMTWAQLPVVHPVIAASANLIRKRFSGNMGNEFVVTEPGPTKEEAPIDLPDEAIAMRQIEDQDGGGTTVTTTIKEEQVTCRAPLSLSTQFNALAFQHPLTCICPTRPFEATRGHCGNDRL
jgi:hypothetical protein